MPCVEMLVFRMSDLCAYIALKVHRDQKVCVYAIVHHIIELVHFAVRPQISEP